MNMRKTILLFSIFLTIAGWGCQSEEDISYTRVELKLSTSKDITVSKWTSLVYTFTNKGSGRVSTLERENQSMLTHQLEEGVYDIMVSGTMKVVKEGKTFTGNFSALKQSVSLIGQELVPVQLTMALKPEASPLVFEEIYISGSRTAANKTFRGDQFFVIRNNSDETQNIQGLAIGETSQTNSKTDDLWEKVTDGVVVQTVYTVPFGGTKTSLKPGESLVIAKYPVEMNRDDRYGNAASPVKSLASADFQWYDDYKGLDIDVPEVPNLIKYYSYSPSIWVASVAGNRGYVLFRVDNTAPDAFASSYQVERVSASGRKMIRVKVPYDRVFDAVELSTPSKKVFSVFPSFLETSSAEFTGPYSGRGVRRKADSNGKLIDTNNSASDFDANVLPAQYPGKK